MEGFRLAATQVKVACSKDTNWLLSRSDYVRNL